MKDLEFIRSVVKEWPVFAGSVRLDEDGEICFAGGVGCDHDFYPEDIEAAKDAFSGASVLGPYYTREQWAGESL